MSQAARDDAARPTRSAAVEVGSLTRCVLVIGLALVATACHAAGRAPPASAAPSPPLVVTRPAMGVRFQIALVGDDHAALTALAAECLDEVDRLERILDNWSPDSDISRLNAAPADGWTPVDSELAGLLAAALDMSAATGGAHDVTVGPLLAAWGFDDRVGQVPDPATLTAARAATGWTHLAVTTEPPAVQRDVAGMVIDVSSVAKGWAVDRVVERLRATGVRSAFVSAGGSTVYALGTGVDGSGWPFDVGLGEPWALIDQAVSTSGRSVQDLAVEGGAVLSHILDPRTGQPAQAGVARVVFRAPRATEADMASTAAVVLGPDATAAWFDRRATWARWRTAVFWLDDGSEPVVISGPTR